MALDTVQRQFNSIQRPPDQTEESFNQLKNVARSLAVVTVVIEGMDAERVVFSSAQALDESLLPHRIKQVTFDSAAALQQHNAAPNNRFNIQLDFSEPPGFQVYNPWDQPTPNNSHIEVLGPDQTWVNGVFESVSRFFQQRRRRRNWLHSPTTFTLLQYLLGFPAALWIVYRLDSSWLRGLQAVHSTVRGAIYIYVFLMALVVFRGVIGGFRWLFPIIELEGTRTKASRAILGGVLSSLLLSLTYDILRTLFWP
jgi:hypothetical protein